MRVRSTGLGRTEMILRPDRFTINNGYLIFSLRSIEPVNWRVRVLIERKDMGRLLLLILKGQIFIWLLSLLKKPAALPEDY